MVNRIAGGGVDYLRQGFIHVMRDSGSLAEEPEFADLYLDEEKIIQVTERWLEKYDKRLVAAKKIGPDEHHKVFDEMRIKVIADLATPEFRKDVDGRLHAVLDRLAATDDLDKLETVLYLIPLLAMKDIPWGLCGLILQIHRRTLQKAMRKYEEEEEIYGELLEEIESEEGDEVDIVKLLEAPEKLEQIKQKLFAKPGLRERIEKQIWDMVVAFEQELLEGKVALDLFTQEELVSPFGRIQVEFGEGAGQLEPSDETRERFLDILRQTIAEIMTAERQERFRSDVQAKARTWLRERRKWGAALQAELNWLEDTKYEENRFVLAAFMGQVKRSAKTQKPAKKSKTRRK
ncbi:MAG: hypothetical protein P8Y03_18390 [Anaerolineales bacterium]